MIVGLSELKAHLRVDSDDENSLITAFGEAAEQQVRDYIGRPIYASAADMPAPGAIGYDAHQMVADRAVTVSIMMIADRLYRERGGEGGSNEDAVPPASVRALLAGHRVFSSITPLVSITPVALP